jgi:hypothetical protein
VAVVAAAVLQELAATGSSQCPRILQVGSLAQLRSGRVLLERLVFALTQRQVCLQPTGLAKHMWLVAYYACSCIAAMRMQFRSDTSEGAFVLYCAAILQHLSALNLPPSTQLQRQQLKAAFHKAAMQVRWCPHCVSFTSVVTSHQGISTSLRIIGGSQGEKACCGFGQNPSFNP